MYEIKKISDLRFFASKGNATVILDVHPITRVKQKCSGTLKRDGIYIEEAAVVKGKRQIVRSRESLPRAFAHIQSIKLGRNLVAERKKGALNATPAGVYLLTKKQSIEKVYQKKEHKIWQSFQNITVGKGYLRLEYLLLSLWLLFWLVNDWNHDLISSHDFNHSQNNEKK